MAQRHSTEGAHELVRAGSTIRYWLEGEPTAPLVALTHGVSIDHRTFAAQVPALVAAGYRVLTWDIRGHGQSQPLGRGLSIPAVADDLIALLDDAGADRAVLVGQSFGGMLIQDALARHPERVAALAVLGAPALSDRPGAVMRVLQRLRVASTRIWPDDHLRRTFAALVTRDPHVRAYVREAARQPSRQAFLAVSRAAMEGYLAGDDTPTHGAAVLLAHGEREESLVERSMRAWAARDPSARYEVVPGAGHLVNQEQPTELNDVLVDFLDGLDLRRSGSDGNEAP